MDIPLDTSLERLAQRALDPITGHRYHHHEHPTPKEEIYDRVLRHPTDDDELVQKRYQSYIVYYDELQDYYSQIGAIHILADQDPYSVFEAVEAGIVNQLNKDDN